MAKTLLLTPTNTYGPVKYVVTAMQSRSQAPQVCQETSLDLVHSLLSILPDVTILLLLVNHKGCGVDLQLQRLLVVLQELLRYRFIGGGLYL